MTVRSIFLLALALCLCGTAATAKEPNLFDRLEKLLLDPPATGILVTQVMPETQAMALGIQVGDIVVSYGGIPVADLPALGAAKESLGEAESIEMVIERDGKRIALSLAPGSIGFMGVAVEKGVAGEVLPPDTGVKFDFSRLMWRPQDEWSVFTLDGVNKAGFEHGKLQLRGDTLILRREVGFDGGEQWGLQHFDVTVILDTKPRLRVLATSFLNPLTEWLGTGRLVKRRGKGQVAKWRATVPGAEPRMEPAPRRLLPSYIIESLAGFMPREKGACHRFIPLSEGFGQVGLPSALVCEGQEEVTLPSFIGRKPETRTAWKYVWYQLGGAVSGTYWIGEDGRTLIADYRGARAYRSRALVAMGNLPDGIMVRSGPRLVMSRRKRMRFPDEAPKVPDLTDR